MEQCHKLFLSSMMFLSLLCSFIVSLDSHMNLVHAVPLELEFCTFLGGSGNENAEYFEGGVVIDDDGYVYISGTTSSSDFPTLGALMPTGSYDVFVTKIAPGTGTLVFSTYLGGSGNDEGYGIARDNEDQLYIIGATRSLDFPTKNAYDGVPNDIFLTKLETTGNNIIFSTYLGGSMEESGDAIVVDTNECVYVAGTTESIDFPTKNACQKTYAGTTSLGHDLFIMKFEVDGTDIVYSTYLGGENFDASYDLALDKHNNTYIAGFTSSEHFPTKNALQGTFHGGGFLNTDGFVAKLNNTGDTTHFVTYLGGFAEDYVTGIAVDKADCAYISGSTDSGDFPTFNAFQKTTTGGDAFVSKLDPTGTGFIYSTFLGGVSFDNGDGITIDDFGSAYVVGSTKSNDFPTKHALQSMLSGFSHDLFVTKLSPSGTSLVYSTYLGGSDFDSASNTCIAAGNDGQVVVAGMTTSTDFPTFHAFQTVYGGGYCDVIVAKLVFSNIVPDTMFFLTGMIILILSFVIIIKSNKFFSWDFPKKNSKIVKLTLILVVYGYVNTGMASSASPELTIEGISRCAMGASRTVLTYSSYLGGVTYEGLSSSFDCVAIDENNNIYICGETQSPDFPTKNAFQKILSYGYTGESDVFITKLKSDGSSLIYSTYLGGIEYDCPHALVVNDTGYVFLTGLTKSPDFPTLNAFQGEGDSLKLGDVFLAKLDRSGSMLEFSTYLGGNSADWANKLVFDKDDYIYLTGGTLSGDFPTKNAFHKTGGASSFPDVFLTKMDPMAGSLMYSTYLETVLSDEALGLAVDRLGCAYITGHTYSPSFPTKYAYQTNRMGSSTFPDGFVTKFNNAGSDLVFSTYLGSTEADHPIDIAVDNSGNVYIAGFTNSPHFPTKNAYQKKIGPDNSDAFVSVLNSSGKDLLVSTFLGGDAHERIKDIVLNSDGCLYVTGFTKSLFFPVSNEFQTHCAGDYDVFITKFNDTITDILFSTYLGGSDYDVAGGIKVDDLGAVYVVGQSRSNDFPTTHSFQGRYGGNHDAFIVKFEEADLVPIDTRFMLSICVLFVPLIMFLLNRISHRKLS